MTRIIFILFYIILTALTIAYIDNGIKTYDMDFYHGKDNGYFLRFESIIILNTIFYLLMTIRKESKVMDYLKQAGLGLLTAIVISIITYYVFHNGLTYHIATILICYSLCFILKKSKPFLRWVLHQQTKE